MKTALNNVVLATLFNVVNQWRRHGVDWGGDEPPPPLLTKANFLIRPNPVRKGGGGYDSGIESRNTGLGKFQNKRHSCSNIYINM